MAVLYYRLNTEQKHSYETLLLNCEGTHVDSQPALSVLIHKNPSRILVESLTISPLYSRLDIYQVTIKQKPITRVNELI
jgi:hypothetical protein